MASNLRNGFAIYPMVEEEEATGVVAGVYAELLSSMPFVPSLFKSLALCPGYLVLAFEQCASVLSTQELDSAAQQLAASVRGAARAPDEEKLRSAVAQFEMPLSRMLLMSCGLLVALQDELAVPPAPGHAPGARPAEPARPAPSQWDADAAALYGEIRAALDTPVVNSIWRRLAQQGDLAATWAALGHQAPQTRSAADALQQAALDAARQLPWQVVASPAALARAALTDATPGMTAVLDAYVKTLSRVLTLTASSAPGFSRR